jgi:hypothetical protein
VESLPPKGYRRTRRADAAPVSSQRQYKTFSLEALPFSARTLNSRGRPRLQPSIAMHSGSATDHKLACLEVKNDRK